MASLSSVYLMKHIIFVFNVYQTKTIRETETLFWIDVIRALNVYREFLRHLKKHYTLSPISILPKAPSLSSREMQWKKYYFMKYLKLYNIDILWS